MASDTEQFDFQRCGGLECGQRRHWHPNQSEFWWRGRWARHHLSPGDRCAGDLCIPCPTNYELQAGSTLIGAGLDLTQAPYNLTLPIQDYYTNAIPNGSGSGWNYGADGATH